MIEAPISAVTAGAYLNRISLRRRKNLQQKILQWYRGNRRSLPWRRTREAYRIWISEVMLQQTQTAKVLDYYERFLHKFPDIRSLANASVDDVLKAWEGMGYYARARNLHKAAQFVVASGSGKMPHEYEQLLAIPGIGPYTAAAVASIAFNRDHAVVDGNVERVLSRIFAVDVPPKTATGKALFRSVAAAFLLTGKARDWNQALMELGALVCSPASPSCRSCPAQAYCIAFMQRLQLATFPARLPSRPRPHREVVIGLIWKGGKLLIDQRHPEGLLGGLWEFPGGTIEDGEVHSHALRRGIREGLDIEIEVGSAYTQVEHGFTHFTVTLHVYQCRYQAGEPRALGCQQWQWVSPEELPRYAFPTASRRIIARILNDQKQQ